MQFLPNLLQAYQLFLSLLQGMQSRLYKYWQKPTYASLSGAVDNMRKCCEAMGIKKLVMPKIGCGLDRLNWSRVKQIIKEKFVETDIDIIVCYI